MKSIVTMTNTSAGFTSTLFAMVHRFLRYINSWCAGFSASNVWSADDLGRASHSSMGMVYWQHHGVLHREFRYDMRHREFAPRRYSLSFQWPN